MQPKCTHVKKLKNSTFHDISKLPVFRDFDKISSRLRWIGNFRSTGFFEEMTGLPRRLEKSIRIFFLRIIRLYLSINNLSIVKVSYYCVRLKDLTPLSVTWFSPRDLGTLKRWHDIMWLIMWCSILKEVLKNWLSMRLTQVRLNYCLTSLGNK